MKKIVLTGIKPTGRLTLGNYIGVLKNLKNFQDEFEPYIFVADLHALTLPIEPEELNTNTKDIVAFYLASGLDMSKSHIFLQSMVSAHAELNAIMMNYLYMGELSRMTQFKQKSHLMNESAIGLGLFSYPVLMACDIILYDADIVPVGEDQVQHVELTRDLVRRFNSRYKNDILKEPKAVVNTTGKRIMSLSDPTKKMSKSDPKGDIYLKDGYMNYNVSFEGGGKIIIGKNGNMLKRIGILARNDMEEFLGKKDFDEIISCFISEIGDNRTKMMHIHFSKIEYTKGGEVRHLTFESDTLNYGPSFEPLAASIKKFGLCPVVICESAGTQAEDALKMKNIYEAI